jgi:predicted ATP-dependent serine protease
MHFTKSGVFRGSTALNHAIDSYLTIEKSEDDHELRDIVVHKNRFGSCTFTSFRFGSTGYIFEAVAANGDTEQKSKEKKASKRDVVLQALEEGEKTIADLARETQVNGQYLVSILRDLGNEGVVSKEGKGAQAIFKKL